MPREGIAYAIDDTWRERVEERLKALGMSRAQLARNAGCPRSLVTELLGGKHHQTTYLPELHKALEWDPPQPPLPTGDAGELMYLWERMDDLGKQAMINAARNRLDKLMGRAPARSKKR
jgi:hypothetical protein